MIEWEDRVLVLAARAFGDADAILDVFGQETGRSQGLVRGGRGRRRRGGLQPGNTLQLRWRGRLAEQLGHFSPIEPIEERAMHYFSDPLALSAMTAALALMAGSIPDLVVKTDLYRRTEDLFAALAHTSLWPRLFIYWEIDLLAVLGYGLNLSSCALTGSTDELAYVSPRSGRAVRADAAEEWRARLLRLPTFIADRTETRVPPDDISLGFALTGHFLARRVFGELNRPIPPARTVMLRRLERAGVISTAGVHA